jgi:predicted  nucleic acid-binding Zn-ribbon protein
LTAWQAWGAYKKALIFTESRRTQEYLKRFLDANGYAGKITLFNGSNSDAESKAIYEGWVKENSLNGRATGSKIVDMRSALVENFRDTSEIMIATEAAAEGVNLQFCSLVVNYDLPWNPQRVEQRIGRCHRYGQKHDVVVINFLNQRNDADIRVHQLLEQKFNLFQGVFGASDEVLGTIESGVDFEKRILEIYETCRTPKEIESAFNKLQAELDETIKARMDDARKMLFDNFDEDVHARLKMQLDSAKAQLDKIGRMFWETTKVTLNDLALFNDDELSFDLKKPPYHGATTGIYHLISKDKENVAGRYLYRLSHPLGEHVIDTAMKQDLSVQSLHFDISSHPAKISVIEALKGKSGWLKLGKMTIDSLERHEELVFTACTDDGSSLDHETCQKLFNCGATITGDADIPEDAGHKIGAEEKQRQSAALNRIMEKNNQFFREEHARIDKWADDMIFAAEKELKDIREQIKAIGRQVRLAETIEEQANLQQKELDLTKKRRKLRNQLDDIEDEIEQKARHMKDQLQARLQQKVTTDDLFTIRWSVV